MCWATGLYTETEIWGQKANGGRKCTWWSPGQETGQTQAKLYCWQYSTCIKRHRFLFFFSWNIIALHYCVSFCCIIMWNSLRGSVAFIAQLRLTLCDPMDCSEPGSSHTWPLPLEPPSRPPFHPSRLSQSAWLSSPCYVNAILSIRPTLFSPSLCPHIYSLSLCLCSWPHHRLISTLFFLFVF